MACRSISSSRSRSPVSAAAGLSAGVAHARGQMFRQNQFAAGKQHRPLHRVAQLAHVARPGIAFEARGDRVRKPRAALGEFLDEPASQRQYVLAPFAQRRHVQFHHVQSVKQIFAKTAGLDFVVELRDCSRPGCARWSGFRGWSRCAGNYPSCVTRSSLACSGGDISAISSRKMVPPFACSNRPRRWPWRR